MMQDLSKELSYPRFFLGTICNLLSHYENALFALLAPFIAPLFFPHDYITSLILTYAILPIGFLSKPVGALILGKVSDQYGRKRALRIATIGIAITTLLIAFIPTYKTIGYIAPLLLALGRLFQSFFASAGIITGALVAIENNSSSLKSLLSSLYDSSSIIGILLASSLIYLVSDHIEHNWRYLFILGALFATLPLIFFNTSDATLAKKRNEPLFTLLRRHYKPFFAILLASGLSYGTYAFTTTFLNGFLPEVTDLTKRDAMGLNSLILVFDLLFLPIAGLLALRYTKERVMLFSSFLLLAMSLPLCSLLLKGSLATILFVRVFLVMIGVLFAAPFHAWAQSLLPAYCRSRIISLAYALGSQLIGATVPTICLYLYKITGKAYAPSFYLMTIAFAGSFATYIMIREKKALVEEL